MNLPIQHPGESVSSHRIDFRSLQHAPLIAKNQSLGFGTQAKPITKPKRILVVDDERLIADTLIIILRQAGYEADAAYDGLSALMRCDSFRPDLIITDVVMPNTNGVRMAMLVKKRYPSCKILLFSGQAATTDLLEEARQGGYDFEILQKPINPNDLLTRLIE